MWIEQAHIYDAQCMYQAAVFYHYATNYNVIGCSYSPGIINECYSRKGVRSFVYWRFQSDYWSSIIRDRCIYSLVVQYAQQFVYSQRRKYSTRTGGLALGVNFDATDFSRYQVVTCADVVELMVRRYDPLSTDHQWWQWRRTATSQTIVTTCRRSVEHQDSRWGNSAWRWISICMPSWPERCAFSGSPPTRSTWWWSENTARVSCIAFGSIAWYPTLI